MSQNHRHISFQERLRLETLIYSEAARLKAQAQLLGNLDEEVTNLAREGFANEADFIRWAVEPSNRLGDFSPLEVLGSEGGRQRVMEWLRQIADGVMRERGGGQRRSDG